MDPASGHPIIFGRDGTNNSNDGKGNLDDIKFFNHVLSEKEIDEINKAPALHYSFNNFSEPTTNYANSPVATGEITESTGYSF